MQATTATFLRRRQRQVALVEARGVGLGVLQQLVGDGHRPVSRSWLRTVSLQNYYRLPASTRRGRSRPAAARSAARAASTSSTPPATTRGDGLRPVIVGADFTVRSHRRRRRAGGCLPIHDRRFSMLEGKRMAGALGGLGATVLLGRRRVLRDRRRAEPHRSGPRAAARGQGEERHLLPRRRHGHAGDHRRPLLPVRRGRADERRPAAVHRLPDHVVGQAGARRRYLPDYDPDSASTGTMWATGQKTIDERISQGPSTRDRRAGQEPPDGARAGAAGGQEDRQRLDGRDHRRDAGGARLAHLAARLPGPAGHGDACPTETKAAGGLGSIAEQTVDHKVDVVLGGGRARFDADDHRRPRRRQDRRAVGHAPGLHRTSPTPPASPRRARRTSRCSASSPRGNMTTEWTGPVATLGDGTPAQSACTGQPARRTSRAWPT